MALTNSYSCATLLGLTLLSAACMCEGDSTEAPLLVDLTDSRTGELVCGATVMLEGKAGRIRLTSVSSTPCYYDGDPKESGDYTLVVERDGYKSRRVSHEIPAESLFCGGVKPTYLKLALEPE